MKRYLSFILIVLAVQSSLAQCPATQYTLSGEGAICRESPFTLTLNGSQIGISYQALRDGANYGSPKAGTGNPLTWTNFSAPEAHYTVIAVGCGTIMAGSVDLSYINTAPPFALSGGGALCPDMTGLPISYSGSQVGDTYQLKVDGVNVGSSKQGTGSALLWNNLSTPGAYTLLITNGSTGCTLIRGPVNIYTVPAVPTQYQVGGGGEVCSGTTRSITLNGSQSGVYYQLQRNGINVGAIKQGTGNTLSWSGITTVGTYTVIVPGCGTVMNGSVVVTNNPVQYTVGGGGSICPGSSTAITLSSSQPGIIYQLRRDGTNYGSQVTGTGNAINWTGITDPGTYTVIVVGCGTSMSESATVSNPTLYTLSGDGAICLESPFTLTLNGSQIGISYQALRDGVNYGSPKAGTGNPLTWTNFSAPEGHYTVIAVGCGTLMASSVDLNYINTAPPFALSGGGALCPEMTGLPISYSGSQVGDTYQLKVDEINVGVPKQGTGSALLWDNLSTPGSYSLLITNGSTGCTLTRGPVNIYTVPAVPTQYEVSGGGEVCSGTTRSITLSGSQSGVYYQLQRNGIDAGAPKQGTGNALIWTNVSTIGTYTVMVPGCGTVMNESVVVTNNPTQYTVGGDGSICLGSSATITLSNSQRGVIYQLQLNESNFGATKIGTGSSLAWNNISNAGTYTVVTTVCEKQMVESAVITVVNPPPATITGVTILQADPILLTANAGQDYSYQWKLDGDDLDGENSSTLNVDKPGNYEVVVTALGCPTTSPGHFVTLKATPQFNGLITSVRWRTDKPHEVTGSEFNGMYVYHYDDKNQVKEANWAVPNFTLNTFSYSDNTFRISDLKYDPNGNIHSMRRYNETGVRQHNFAYHYNEDSQKPQQTNQLQYIPGYASYQYNNLGQLIGEDKETGNDQYIEYDASGKVRMVYSSKNATTGALENPKVEFIYDDRGFRLAKKDIASGKTTWYIRDAMGDVLSVYESNNGSAEAKQIEAPVYGSGKVGTYYPKQVGTGYYQDGSTDYEITDHLGNIRALVRDNVNAYAASMEDSGQPVATNPRVKEMQHFINLFETEKTDVYMNHSPATTEVSSPNKSAYLFWQEGVQGIDDSDKLVGPGIMLEVKAGDKVNAEAWVRYERKASYARNIDLFMLSQFLGSNFVGIGGFEGYTVAQASSTFQSALTVANFMSDGTDEIRPFAYLNYILFNENMTLADAGWKRIPENAGHTSGQEALPGMHQKVAFDESVEVDANGYIYVWVSNESENTKVWFDDLKVTHEESFVTQATDYGVWGDVIREQKSILENYRYGYQGQYAEKDAQTGWNHFELRQYDPIIGRWTIPDPGRQYWSPYNGMGNDPINFTDPDGAYTYMGALLRSGFGLRGEVYEEEGEFGFNTFDGDHITVHFGEERKPPIDPFDVSGIPAREPYGNLEYFFFGGIEDNGVWYNQDGTPRLKGVVTGTPPSWVGGPAGGLKGAKVLYNLHHSYPKFLGGLKNQQLTKITAKAHKALHKELNAFLSKITKNGKSMAPSSTNPGRMIQRRFSTKEIEKALTKFYRGPGAKYKQAATDFFKQIGLTK